MTNTTTMKITVEFEDQEDTGNLLIHLKMMEKIEGVWVEQKIQVVDQKVKSNVADSGAIRAADNFLSWYSEKLSSLKGETK